MIEKYRVHEVAKDLNIPSKDIIALLEEHFPGEPKKHMTALTDAELNLVFDKFTRERSLPKLDSYFALQSEKPKAPAAPKPAPAPKAEEKPAAPAAGSVFCSNCGKALPAGSRFCDGCGSPVT